MAAGVVCGQRILYGANPVKIDDIGFLPTAFMCWSSILDFGFGLYTQNQYETASFSFGFAHRDGSQAMVQAGASTGVLTFWNDAGYAVYTSGEILGANTGYSDRNTTAFVNVDTWDKCGLSLSFGSSFSVAILRYIAFGGSALEAKVGSFTLLADGSTATVDAGFTGDPALVFLGAGSFTDGNAALTLGAASASDSFAQCICGQWLNSGGYGLLASGAGSIGIYGAPEPFVPSSADWQSSIALASPGFSLPNENPPSGDVTHVYLALGGTLDAAVGTHSYASGSGTHTISGLSFAPDAAMQVFGKQDESTIGGGFLGIGAKDKRAVGGPLPFATVTPVLDTFNRANSASLGANWTADVFANPDASPAIVSNTCAFNSGGTQSAWWNKRPYGPDCEVYATIAQVGGVNSRLVFGLRLINPGTSSGSGYTVRIPFDGFAYIRRTDNAVGTNLSFWNYTATVGDIIRFTAVGPILTLYYQRASVWNWLGGALDSTYPNAGYFYVQGNSSNGDCAWDDFGGGKIANHRGYAGSGYLGINESTANGSPDRVRCDASYHTSYIQDGYGTLNDLAEVSAFASDGFTINSYDGDGATREYGYVAIKGARASASGCPGRPQIYRQIPL